MIWTALILAGAAAAAPASITNSIGMKFLLVQPGEMTVGVFTPSCPSTNGAGPPSPYPPPRLVPGAEWSDADRARCAEIVKADTRPGFPVTIAKAFYLGQFEVTQAQWRAVMGSNPSMFQGAKAEGNSDDRPVDSVSWRDAQAFVAKLNAREKTKAYRLPTEFEWEYACRAGGPGQQSWQNIGEQAAGIIPMAARRAGAKNLVTTVPAGSKAPNDWGFQDMLGNVWEWVADSYNGELFANPKPQSRAAGEHVLKGGAFTGDVKNVICATHAGGPGDKWNVGFRILKSTLPE